MADLHGIQDALLTSDFNKREIWPLEMDVVAPPEVLRNRDILLCKSSLLVHQVKRMGPSCLGVDSLYPEGLVEDFYTERSMSITHEVE